MDSFAAPINPSTMQLSSARLLSFFSLTGHSFAAKSFANEAVPSKTSALHFSDTIHPTFCRDSHPFHLDCRSAVPAPRFLHGRGLYLSGRLRLCLQYLRITPYSPP